MKPSIGSKVIVRSNDAAGTTAHPAVVTRVCSPQPADTIDGPVRVNVTALPDGAVQPVCHASIDLHDTEQQAVEQTKAHPGLVVAHWPPHEHDTAPT